ncbi:MAG: ImmA/IrrE family metallo-endopeptidase [Polyangiales bacterium]
MGIELHMVTHPGWDGAVKSSPERAAIWLDAGKPRVRRRFTLAHELGHLMLHPLGEEFRDLADPTRPTHSYREKQANRFAAELLMPSWMLPPYVEAADGKINVLAQIFQVSTAAMTIRLETLHGPRTL